MNHLVLLLTAQLPPAAAPSILERTGYILTSTLTLPLPKLSTLDALKFISSTLWPALFSHPITSLKTNHRGLYLLTDDQCVVGKRDLVGVCSIVKGSLANLGIAATVSATSTNYPICEFPIFPPLLRIIEES